MSGSESGGSSERNRPRRSRLAANTRGVQWTLEAFLAVLLLVSALVIVAQAVPVGTQQAEAELARAQLQQAGDDVLGLAEADGNLSAAVLYWNTTAGSFVNTSTDIGGEPHYVSVDAESTHPLGVLLAETLGERPVAYNMYISYETALGSTERRPLIYQGPPGSDSVTTSATVLLFGDDEPHATAGNCTLAELAAATDCGDETFYAPDIDPTSNRHNTVQIQLELWRI